MRRWIRLLHKFRLQTAEERSLIAESVAYLVATRLALRLLPFRWIKWYVCRQPQAVQVSENERARLRCRIGTVIEWVAVRLPGETVCFPRAIAAQAMLRRRGIGVTLYYGAASLSDRGLTAHAWVQDGPDGVIGHHDASGFHVLATFPELKP